MTKLNIKRGLLNEDVTIITEKTPNNITELKQYQKKGIDRNTKTKDWKNQIL